MSRQASYLRKVDTNEVFSWTRVLARRADMVPITKEEAEKLWARNKIDQERKVQQAEEAEIAADEALMKKRIRPETAEPVEPPAPPAADVKPPPAEPTVEDQVAAMSDDEVNAQLAELKITVAENAKPATRRNKLIAALSAK